MEINAGYNPCMFLGFMKPPPAVKRNTTYRVRIRYRVSDLAGPRVAGNPFGFVAKTGGWLWGSGNNCQDPGTGTVVTPYQAQNTSDWQILEGSLTTGNSDFLPFFYLVMENVSQGTAYVDYCLDRRGPGQRAIWAKHHLQTLDGAAPVYGPAELLRLR